MKYATVTTTVTQDITYVLDGDFPADFDQRTDEQKYEWLDEHADCLSTETYNIKSIDQLNIKEG